MSKLLGLAVFPAVAVAHGAIELHGSGTTNPSKFFWEVMDLFEARASPMVKMSYRAVGSGTGQYEFIGEDNKYTAWNQDFGSGDIPIPKEAYKELFAADQEFVHFPFQIGAMSFFHNVPGVPEGGLKLDGCLLARIFKRDITTWDHADIMATNPELSVPTDQEIKVYHRVSGSSTTGGITTYLNAACPDIWTAGMVGSKIDWAAGTFEAQGSGKMSSSISSNEYSIGYIDAGHGHDDFLQEIELMNKAGKYRSSTEAAEVDGVANAAAAAIDLKALPSDPLEDFSQVSLHNMDGEDVWPIVAVSYIYARTNQTQNGEKACLLKAFMEFVISDEGQSLLPAYNFVGIPPSVKDVAQKAIDELDMPDCTQWAFEGSSDTQKGVGQAQYVISGKRRDFGEYDRANIHSDVMAVIADLKEDIAKTTAVANELMAAPRGAIALHGSGTTNPSKFFWEVMNLFEARASPMVKMSYRAVGSGTGQYEFLGETNNYTAWNQDFGSGDIPIPADKYQDMKDAGEDFMHFPFQIGAMNFFHNVPNVPTGGLKLDACLLARIFKRDITTWDHADIMASNPELSVPKDQAIKVYHRVSGSSTTGGITTYLNAACPDIWTAGMVGSKIDWAAGTFEAQGSGKMSSSISSNEYSIGYIDAGHGLDDFLQEIELMNKAGKYRSSLQAAAVDGVQNAATKALEAGVLPSEPLADFSQVSLHNMDGADVWPIVAVSYIYARKDQSQNGEKACLLKAFMEFVISDEGQSLLPAYNFVGIPDQVKEVAQKGIDELVMPDCTQWRFESSTDKGAGQLPFVVSGKRRDFAEYDRGNIHSDLLEVIADLKEEIARNAAAAGVNVQAVEPTAAPEHEHDNDSDSVLGLVGLIVSIIALIFAIAAFCKSGPKGQYSGVPQTSDNVAV